MDLLSFGHSLETLRMNDIRSIAAHLAAARDSIAEEIEMRKAVLHVEHMVHRSNRKTQAAMAGLTVVALVQDAARRDAVRLPDDDVTRVARTAASVARALVVGFAAEREARLLAAAFDRISVRSGV